MNNGGVISVYNPKEHSKQQIIDTTVFKTPDTGGYLLQQWSLKGSNNTNSSKIQNFMEPTKASSPTGSTGVASLHLIGVSLMYIETRSNNSGDENVFVSFERTDNIQISSRVVSRADGGVLRSLCIKIGYSEPTRAESREGTSILAESSRVT